MYSVFETKVQNLIKYVVLLGRNVTCYNTHTNIKAKQIIHVQMLLNIIMTK